LESWDAARHPAQQRLRMYIASVIPLFPEVANHDGAPLALALSVGLEDHIALTRGGHDLDNYLFPLARAFGAHRFSVFFAHKRHAGTSTLTIGCASPDPNDRGMPHLQVRTRVSATSKAWKEAIHEACRQASPQLAADVPVHLQLAFQVSPGRNWSALWKPAIDALGPVLGLADPARPYRPRDDRITRLELHRTIDSALGHDIVLTARWHDATVGA
ncbi:hypothetical protein, partial [Streptacidiphilus anmyonensis]|uniref:hypothetical protein n=1 Tax=Streptacidiphilus anmyonensis TaxID=405782 RepID=UPI001F187187